MKRSLLVLGLPLVLVANIAGWVYVRTVYLSGFGPVEMWQAQSSLAQALLLFDTLLIVWAYVHGTQHHMREAERQAAAAQHDLQEDRMKGLLGRVERLLEMKPVVVTNLVLLDGSPMCHIQNVGTAVAINVWYYEKGLSRPLPLGSLAPRESRAAPFEFAERHLLIAEGRGTRKFIPSMNLREGDGIAHGLVRLNDKALNHEGALAAFLDLQSDMLDTLGEWIPRTWEEPHEKRTPPEEQDSAFL